MHKLYSKYFVLVVFLNLFILFSFAQKVDIEWEYNFEHEKNNSLEFNERIKDGSYILGGRSTTKVNLNPNIDVFYSAYQIIKLDENGKEVWQMSFGGERYDYIKEIIETKDGGFLVGGSSDSHISGNKTVGTFGVSDMWILKLDKNGNVEWQKSYGGLSEDFFGDFIEVEDGYLLAGSSWSINNGNKSAPRIGRHDFWLIKINEKGEMLWDKTFGGLDHDYLSNITLLSDGHYLLSGSSYSNEFGYKSEDARGEKDVWIVKVDKNGNYIWDKTFGGYSHDSSHDAFTTQDDGIILVCYSSSGVSGEKKKSFHYSSLTPDVWILKFDINGNEIWQQALHFTDNKFIEMTNNDLAYISLISQLNEKNTDFNKHRIPYYVTILDELGEFKNEIYIGIFDRHDYDYLLQTKDESFLLGGFKFKDNLSDQTIFITKTNINVIKIFDDVDTENLDNNLNVYPNPFSDQINIDYDKGLTVKMYNSTGGKIVETKSKYFSIENLAQGFYMLHIYNVKGDLISINKVIKKL